MCLPGLHKGHLRLKNWGRLAWGAARIPTVQMGKLRLPVGLFVQKVLALLSASHVSPAPRLCPSFSRWDLGLRAPGLDPSPASGGSKGLYPLPPMGPLLWLPRRKRGRASEYRGQDSTVPALMPPRGGEKSAGPGPQTLRALPQARAVERGGRWAPRKSGVQDFSLAESAGAGLNHLSLSPPTEGMWRVQMEGGGSQDLRSLAGGSPQSLG